MTIGGTDVEPVQHAVVARIARRRRAGTNRDACLVLQEGRRIVSVDLAACAAEVKIAAAVVDRSATATTGASADQEERVACSGGELNHVLVGALSEGDRIHLPGPELDCRRSLVNVT